MNAVPALAATVSVRRACDALGVSRATWYRARRSRPTHRTRPRPPLALLPEEVDAALAVLHAERFVDLSPRAIHAILLEEHRYLASVSTLYRLLASRKESRERRAQRRHPRYARPELLTTGPNQLWSWDITKLKGPAKWVCFHLYVILDVFSRCVVGWMVAHRESAELARRLIRHACRAHRIPSGQLTLHADRGSSMKSRPVALLLADLGVTKTHARPHVSNDNPYSEAQFKTLKYRPEFPDRFGSLEDARAFCQAFFHWYNHEHRHSGIAQFTPAVVHQGLIEPLLRARQATLDAAFRAHPKRFKGAPPVAQRPPNEVWINPPTPATRPPPPENLILTP